MDDPILPGSVPTSRSPAWPPQSTGRWRRWVRPRRCHSSFEGKSMGNPVKNGGFHWKIIYKWMIFHCHAGKTSSHFAWEKWQYVDFTSKTWWVSMFFSKKIWVKQVVIREIGLGVSEKKQFQWSRIFFSNSVVSSNLDNWKFSSNSVVEIGLQPGYGGKKRLKNWWAFPQTVVYPWKSVDSINTHWEWHLWQVSWKTQVASRLGFRWMWMGHPVQ